MLKEDFLLDDSVIFLNHGSFGACPKPVFEQYQAWQRELERQPVLFMGRQYDTLLDQARASLAEYLHAPTESLVFVPNATIGLNTVARSLPLQAGDEILATNHEYGAMDYMWQFIAKQTGAHYLTPALPEPFTTEEAFLEAFWQQVTPKTRVIFISHITSPTALIFPLQALIAKARAHGIFTVVDGAHAPAYLDLDLTALDPDFYSGNCHKWLCAPKGTAFLYVRPEHQALIQPLVISWGYPSGHFVTQNQWQGTRDIAGFLSVPEAIRYQEKHDWRTRRTECRALAHATRQELITLTGIDPVAPLEWVGQMVAHPLPPCDALSLKTRLYDHYKIECPVTKQGGRDWIRVAFQVYNTQADADSFLNALRLELPHFTV